MITRWIALRRIGTVGLSLLVLGSATAASAITMTYTERAPFEARLGTLVVDDYSDPAYTSGDVSDTAFDDTFSNAAMSAVIGETDYTSSG